jgi:outer membrane receptor protein involved in Fe transport
MPMLFVKETLAPARWVALSASARLDRQRLEIEDRLGRGASGEHVFERPSPAVGVVLGKSDGVQFYARYGESFRAPTPVELA